jgi:hypothetical protein
LVSEVPFLLTATQWILIGFELAAPLLLIRGRIGRWMLAACLAFHGLTFASIAIVFLPHMICLLSFVPLERIAPQRLRPALPRPLAHHRTWD